MVFSKKALFIFLPLCSSYEFTEYGHITSCVWKKLSSTDFPSIIDAATRHPSCQSANLLSFSELQVQC